MHTKYSDWYKLSDQTGKCPLSIVVSAAAHIAVQVLMEMKIFFGLQSYDLTAGQQCIQYNTIQY